MKVIQERFYEKTVLNFCTYAQREVRILSCLVHPADRLPDGPPRITRRVCDAFAECTLQDKSACPAAVTMI